MLRKPGSVNKMRYFAGVALDNNVNVRVRGSVQQPVSEHAADEVQTTLKRRSQGDLPYGLQYIHSRHYGTGLGAAVDEGPPAMYNAALIITARDRPVMPTEPCSNTTVYRTLLTTASRHPDRPALRFRRDGYWQHMTYRDLAESVRALRRALHALGVRRGHRVAILSYNRPEWIIADLAIQALGAIDVPIYHTLPAAQVAFYLADAGASIVFTEDAAQTAKAASLSSSLPAIIQFSGTVAEPALSYEALLAEARPDDQLDQMLDSQELELTPDDTATFIYTSGTTGDPKGAMLSHRALLYTAGAAQQVVPVSEHDVFLSFLPLCHVVERVGGYYLPLVLGAEIVQSQGPFALAGELAEARPSAFICVPRFYDTLRQRILDTVAHTSGLRRTLAQWALRVGQAHANARLNGDTPGWFVALQHRLADRLVLETIRRKATGGAIRFLVSGGAPLHPDTGMFLETLGLSVLEGYGLTEFPVISLNRPGQERLRCVGHPLPGIEVRIGGHGEILARGPSLMAGYHARPEATAAVIDGDGWFHTGDVGLLDEEGRLRITDRIKDIIVLANGKNIAPQTIELRLTRSTYIADAVLFGDGHMGLVALIVPAFEAVRDWLRRRGATVQEAETICADPSVLKLIRDEISAQTADLADFEQIKGFRLIPKPFTVENGELTPTMKAKRRVIAERYGRELATLLRR
jgi:long-chain acyl-CoA synthetase